MNKKTAKIIRIISYIVLYFFIGPIWSFIYFLLTGKYLPKNVVLLIHTDQLLLVLVTFITLAIIVVVVIILRLLLRSESEITDYKAKYAQNKWEKKIQRAKQLSKNNTNRAAKLWDIRTQRAKDLKIREKAVSIVEILGIKNKFESDGTEKIIMIIDNSTIIIKFYDEIVFKSYVQYFEGSDGTKRTELVPNSSGGFEVVTYTSGGSSGSINHVIEEYKPSIWEKELDKIYIQSIEVKQKLEYEKVQNSEKQYKETLRKKLS